MRRNESKNNQSTSLHDITFLMAAGFFILFVVALWYVNPIAKLGKVDTKAEILIKVEWPGDMNVDVDTWVLDPNGILTWYAQKTPNHSPVQLDRDDLGHSNDTMIVDGRPIIVKENNETVSIRSILPGEYIVSLHLYNNYSYSGAIPVTVTVEKINPRLQKVFFTENPIILSKRGQEIMVVRFTVDPDGAISDVSTSPTVSLIKIGRENQRNNPTRSSGMGGFRNFPQGIIPQ